MRFVNEICTIGSVASAFAYSLDFFGHKYIDMKPTCTSHFGQ